MAITLMDSNQLTLQVVLILQSAVFRQQQHLLFQVLAVLQASREAALQVVAAVVVVAEAGEKLRVCYNYYR
jgi:hypothetical protein